MEIQRELFHGETLEVPSAITERAEIYGNRENRPKLQVSNGMAGALFQGKESTSDCCAGSANS